MRTLVAILALTVMTALVVSPLPADEPPHLSFVQKLRARGDADIALQYLTEILSVNPPPELKPLLPLEIARTRLEMASLKADAGQRAAAYKAARDGFEEFIKANPEHPLVADARLELARILTLEGRAQLAEARRQETDQGRQAGAQVALKTFAAAIKPLEEAAAQIDARLVKLPAQPKTAQEKAARQALAAAKLQAEFEQGMNYFNQARAHDTLGNNEQLTKSIEKARDIFRSLAARGEKHTLCVQARAWAGRTYQAEDKHEEARKEYKKVEDEVGPHAEDGKRLVLYFRLLQAKTDPGDKKEPTAEVRRLGELWLQRYGGYADTPEGQGVRFELANAYLEAAKTLQGKAKTPPGPALQLYARAEKLFKPLADVENEYQHRARQNWSIIIFTTGESRSGGKIEDFKNFEDCFIRAQYEAAMLERDEKDNAALRKKTLDGLPVGTPPEKREAIAKELDKKAREGRKKREADLVKALTQALQVADSKVPQQDLIDARAMLAYVYLTIGEPYRAAVIGEVLGQRYPANSRAAAAAGYALQAYAQIIYRSDEVLQQELKDNPKSEKAAALAKAIEADRNQLRRLAQYIEQNCKDVATVDFARHQLGGLLLQEKKFKEGIDVLARIGAGYGHAPQARFQMALAAMEVEKDDQVLPAEKEALRKRVAASLRELPEIPDNADPRTAEFYIRDKLLLVQWLYPEKKFDEMEKQALALQQRIEKLRLDDDKLKQDLQGGAAAMILWAKQGQARDALAKGDLKRVRELTDPAVEEIKRGAAAEGHYAALRRDLILINLRATVKDGKIDQAQELLTLLQKSDPDDQTGSNVLIMLVADLKEELDELKLKAAKGDKSAAEQLNATKDRFSAFLDVMAKRKGLQPRNVLFLANSYSTLGNHKAALKMIDDNPIKEPKEPTKPNEIEMLEKPEVKEKYDKAMQDYQQGVGMYRAAQVMRVRELRLLAKNTTGADKKEERDAGFKQALEAIHVILKKDWGKGFLDAHKERVMILEDWERYGGPEGAAFGWNELMQKLKPPYKDAKQKENYYDCYYHVVYCVYKNAPKILEAAEQKASSMDNEEKKAKLLEKAKKSKANEIKKAAGFIVKLEGPEPSLGGEHIYKRYKQLLENEPELKKAYIDGGGKLLLSAEELAQLKPKKEEAKSSEEEAKTDDKKGSEAKADARGDSKERMKLMLFVGGLLLCLGVIGFAFFKWIKS